MPTRPQTAWEHHYLSRYEGFISNVLSWRPDYIVPVARKSCKLFSSLDHLFKPVRDKVFYREYFLFNEVPLESKKIAIVDDSVKRTSTLKEYRDFFVIQKHVPQSNIRTYGFVGHSQIQYNPDLMCDPDASVAYFLPPAAYLEYQILQSNHLIFAGTQQDIDHLVVEVEITNISNEDIDNLKTFLERWGYFYQLDPVPGLDRFGLHNPTFFSTQSIISTLGVPASEDFVEKLRFIFLNHQKKLLFVPMIFPRLDDICIAGCSMLSSDFKYSPFPPPCQRASTIKTGKLCYLCTCLFLSTYLARSFCRLLRREGQEFSKYFDNLAIKDADLIRYLGSDVGHNVATSIETFLKADTALGDYLLPLDRPITRPDNELSLLPFSRLSMTEVLSDLRHGYDRMVQANNGDPVGIKYSQPATKLLCLGGGIHPLMFSEALDELCDYGTLVPFTRFLEEESCWRRTYRSGEDPHDRFQWRRTQFIVALAIQTLAISGVKRMYLEKSLANFVYDFPAAIAASIHDHSDLHCLIPAASYWGTQMYAEDPLSKELVPLCPDKLQGSLKDKWKELAQYFSYDERDKSYHVAGPLKGIAEVFDNVCRVDARLIKDYFRLMADIKSAFGNNDILNRLALCRNGEWFYKHLMWNVYGWCNIYKDFLKQLERGIIDDNRLHNAGGMASSAETKIGGAAEFLADIEKCKILADKDPVSFESIWNNIENNIIRSEHPLLEMPKIAHAASIVNAICILGGITRVRLNRVNKAKYAKTMNHLQIHGSSGLEKIGINMGIMEFIQCQEMSTKDNYRILNRVYEHISNEVRRMEVPAADLREVRKSAEMRRHSHFIRATAAFKHGAEERLFDDTTDLQGLVTKIGDECGLSDGYITESKTVKNGGVIFRISDAFGQTVVVELDRAGRTRHCKKIA